MGAVEIRERRGGQGEQVTHAVLRGPDLDLEGKPAVRVPLLYLEVEIVGGVTVRRDEHPVVDRLALVEVTGGEKLVGDVLRLDRRLVVLAFEQAGGAGSDRSGADDEIGAELCACQLPTQLRPRMPGRRLVKVEQAGQDLEESFLQDRPLRLGSPRGPCRGPAGRGPVPAGRRRGLRLGLVDRLR